MITERTLTDLIEVLPETGQIQVRKCTIIERDGVEITRTYHRYVVEPVEDAKDPAAAAIAAVVQTPALKEQWLKREKKRQKEGQDEQNAPGDVHG